MWILIYRQLSANAFDEFLLICYDVVCRWFGMSQWHDSISFDKCENVTQIHIHIVQMTIYRFPFVDLRYEQSNAFINCWWRVKANTCDCQQLSLRRKRRKTYHFCGSTNASRYTISVHITLYTHYILYVIRTILHWQWLALSDHVLVLILINFK